MAVKVNVSKTMTVGHPPSFYQATFVNFNVTNYSALMKQFEVAMRDGIVQLMVAQGVPPDSQILDSVDVGYSNGLFQVLANDYYQALSKGRKPKARKVPIKALIKWIKEKGIPFQGGINNLAFAIQQSIYKNGITGRNFEEAVINFSVSLVDNITSKTVADYALIGTVQIMEKLDITDKNNHHWVQTSVKYDIKGMEEEFKQIAAKRFAQAKEDLSKSNPKLHAAFKKDVKGY